MFGLAADDYDRYRPRYPRPLITEGITDLADFNRDDLRVMEMPAGNGTGTARSVAKLYGSAATGGSEIDVTPSTLDALKKP